MTNDTPTAPRSPAKCTGPIPAHLHGTANAYRNYGCRCGPCRDAGSKSNAEAYARRLGRAAREVKVRGPAEHGTSARYVAGCRCDDCRRAATAAAQERLKRRSFVPAGKHRPWASEIVVDGRRLSVARLSDCWWCRAVPAEGFDHLTPRSRGGSHDSTNVVPSCNRCNTQKGTRTAGEYGEWLRYQAFLHTVVCPTCGRGAGEWCVTGKGTRSKNMHKKRLAIARARWDQRAAA
jgi:5-methylcytosine-specific restriction endonuclease McrA